MVRIITEFDFFLLLYCNTEQVIIAALLGSELTNYMDQITFVCDRGSNLFKALDAYTVVHCLAH